MSAYDPKRTSPVIKTKQWPVVLLFMAMSNFSAAGPSTSFRDCDVCPEMVAIPAGSFTMGSPETEVGRWPREGPQHRVTIAYGFAVGKFEVTFDEWDACVRQGGCSQKPDDWGWGRGRHPVVGISWDDAKQYVGWLSRKTGRTYRLLTEAEWEYVARAGTTSAFSWGDHITPQQANYKTTASYAGSPTRKQEVATVEVGRYAPNAFGLYDVHGNAVEWVEDCLNETYAGGPADGSAWTSGNCRVRMLRGGAWASDPRTVRSAYRHYFIAATRGNPGTGVRVARTK